MMVSLLLAGRLLILVLLASVGVITCQEAVDETIQRLQAEANQALARWKSEFVQQCVAKTPKVRVLAVADQVWVKEMGGAVLSLCATALSLKKYGGKPLDFGVLGLKHAGRETASTRAYWKWVFEERLGTPRPDVASDQIMKRAHIASLLLLDYLELGLEDDNTILIVLDAWDTLFQASLDEVKQTFCELQWKARLDDYLLKPRYGPHAPPTSDTEWREKVIFSAEENCYPYPGYHRNESETNSFYSFERAKNQQVPISDDRFIWADDVCFELERYNRGDRRFLNAGGIAARVKDLRNYLFLNSRIIQLGELFDQGAYQRVMVLRPDLVMLDVEARFFLNIHRAPKAAGERWRGSCHQPIDLPITLWNHTPLVVHFNGNGKGYYNKCRNAMLGEPLELRDCPDYVNLDNLWNLTRARERLRHVRIPRI